MPVVRNKTDKIKMASYLEATKERLEVTIFKAASQLDHVSLRDHKNMLLLEFLNEKGVFLLQQVLANLCFSAIVFLNSAKSIQLLQKFCCSCVALPSLI